MAITTQITTVQVTIDGEYYGDFTADFDTDAADRDYREALEAEARRIAASIVVAANGMVFAELDDVDAALGIDWAELAEEIDVASIVERHAR